MEVTHAVFPPSAKYSLVHWKILAFLLKGTENAENLIKYPFINAIFKSLLW